MHKLMLVLLVMAFAFACPVWAADTPAPAAPVQASTDDIQKAFDQASTVDTVAAYRSVLELFKSDDPAPSTDTNNQTTRSKLYWSIREKIEQLISAEIVKDGIGQRFFMHNLQPKMDGMTGTITITSNGDPDLTLMETLYPGDSMGGAISANGIDMGPPTGNKSILRFIGELHFGGWTINGDSKEPLSFLALAPYGFVYLDGRGTVTSADGKTVSLPVIDDRTPLMLAAVAGDVDKVKALLAAGAEVNAKDKDGETALMKAALTGNNVACVKALDRRRRVVEREK